MSSTLCSQPHRQLATAIVVQLKHLKTGKQIIAISTKGMQAKCKRSII